MRGMKLVAAASLAVSFGTMAAEPSAASTILAEVQVAAGGSALADFELTDGCHQRSVFVFASDEVFKQGPGSPTTSQGGLLLIIDNNLCLGSQTAGWGALEGTSLKMSNVASARLVATATVSDFYDSTLPSSTYALSLTWEGVGPVERGVGHFNVGFPGGRTIYHGVGAFSAATATGSIAPANHPSGNLTAGATGQGTLDQHKEGAMQIIRD